MAALEATDPSAGSVVPVATTVRAVDPSGPDAEQVSDLPAAPPGRRWAGFQGVMVAVPASWSVNDTRCGQPLSDTVAFEHGSFVRCGRSIDAGPSVLRPVSLSSELGQQWQGAEGRSIDMDGLEATRVGGDGCRTSKPPQCGGLLAIASRDAVFVVESRRSAEEVDAILDTARAVPEGYTAVPDVRDGQPEQRLQAVGLRLTSPQPDFPHSVIGTMPVAGSVVPTGTEVSLVIAEG